MSNPFAILDLPAQMHLSPEDLEARYLALSRDHHPDYQTGGSAAEQIEIMQRSAAINDARRILRDPWTRAVALVELLDRNAMTTTKTLCPMFLMEAMEIRERVMEDPPDALDQLDEEIELRLSRLLTAITTHLDRGEATQAATLLHQSNYYRKARKDLRQRTESP